MANDKSIEFFQKEYDRYKKEDHPAAKHIKKILDDPSNKTNVLRNAIHAHCFDCSHDPSDAGGSHPKNCKTKNCPFYDERPISGKEKAEKKASKEVDPEKLKKRQEVAAKARAGRKMSVKEAMELLEGSPQFADSEHANLEDLVEEALTEGKKEDKAIKQLVATIDKMLATIEENPNEKYLFKAKQLQGMKAKLTAKSTPAPESKGNKCCGSDKGFKKTPQGNEKCNACGAVYTDKVDKMIKNKS